MKILFLSALDFKDKSIQVIRKTPEAYARRGWQVGYIVARDACRYGNYAYEEVIDPPGVAVTRFHLPLTWIRDRAGRRTRTLLNKIAGWLAVCRLAWKGLREVRRRGPYQVIYGYECHGVLAAALVRLALKLTFYRRPIRYVSRFQGTPLYETVEKRRYLQLVRRFELVLSGYLPFDLCIMTDDGSRGLDFLQRIRSRSKNIAFLPNGVDRPLPFREPDCGWEELGIDEGDVVILCVSRLVAWKRLDRAIKALEHILCTVPRHTEVQPIKLVIVGGGVCREQYERMADRLGLGASVVFTGPVPHEQVSAYYQRADYFFSFYDISNVGNPLLEAIQHHKIIFTLRNGDTARWIQHSENGFIFEPDDPSLPERVAAAFWQVRADALLRAGILRGVAALEREKLWTWEERLKTEIESVEALHAA